MAALVVGLRAGERIDPLILLMAVVRLYPLPLDPVRRRGVEKLLPELGILHGLLVRRAPAILAPLVNPAGDSIAQYTGCRCAA